MRIVFMGTPDFAVETLEAVIAAGHQVVAAVTQPDKPKGRGGAVSMSPVKQTAMAHNIKVLQPVKASDETFIKELAQLEPEAIVVVAFGQKLPQAILDMPPYGCINVHASLLPKYRGASPVQWAVIDGCDYSGVTTMKMDLGIDTGDILLSERVALDEKETGESLFHKLSAVGAKLLVKTLTGVSQGTIQAVKQEESEATYVKMLDKSFGEIDFSKTAVEIERLVRGLNAWPSAYTFLQGKMLKIWACEVVPLESTPQLFKDKPVKYGEIITVEKNYFTVACKDSFLNVSEVQMEGKKRMCTADFLRGFRLVCGEILGKCESEHEGQ